jgi:2',3'-cyclic-nucleotide 2'-phosphodiesterase
VFIARQERLIRPVNYPTGAPGRGATLIELKNGRRVLVVNALGRLYMDAVDDPFRAVEREVEACPLGQACDAIIVDMHAEATSEKQAMGYFLDGRVSLVVGTHTHVPTADHRILPGGTAYQSDAGMTGNYESILGMDRHEPIRRWLEKTPGSRLEVAEGRGALCGLAVETDDSTGLAINVAPVRVGQVLSEALPGFW